MNHLIHKLPLFACLLFLLACNSEPAAPVAESEVPARPVKVWAPEDTRSVTGYFAERGLTLSTDQASPGYILFNPASSTKTYLMNKEGAIVHSWQSELNCMQAYLRENGNLVRLERDPDFPVFAAGGQAGRIREYNWDGALIWDFEYATDKVLTHHDIELMPNGNILAISYDAKSFDEAVAAGRDPAHTAPAGIWPDKIIEIEPTPPSGGKIVWEWRMWDHLVQDKYPEKPNYGKVNEHPRRINLNVFDPHGGPPPPPEVFAQMKQAGWITSNASPDNWTSDISHTNAIHYHPELDQIAISLPHYNEIFLIDHGTTTAEAKGSTGGRWGHGGDLLYRWGNPQNYGRGGPADQQLFGQHDIRWVEAGKPGAGHLMVFNNDIPRKDNQYPNVFLALIEARHPDPPMSIAAIGNYSAVYEFAAPTDPSGAYQLAEGQPFGPARPDWVYTPPDTLSFYSAFISGAERLPDGHTLILEGATGRMIEVDAEKRPVWEYWNPYFDNYKLPDGTAAQPGGPFIFGQFRVKQYPIDYPAWAGKELVALRPQPEPFVPEPLPPAAGK